MDRLSAPNSQSLLTKLSKRALECVAEAGKLNADGRYATAAMLLRRLAAEVVAAHGTTAILEFDALQLSDGALELIDCYVEDIGSLNFPTNGRALLLVLVVIATKAPAEPPPAAA